jgi:hypothetical protein
MKNAPAGTEAYAAEQAVRGIVARGGAAATLTENLRAASGDAETRGRMLAALRTATLRDDRYRRPLDYTRSWRRYYADRAAERALAATSWYRQLLDNPGGRYEHR